MKKLFTICLLLLCQLAVLAQTYKIALLREPDNACIVTSTPAVEAEVGKSVKVYVSIFTGYVFDGFVSADTIMGPVSSEWTQEYPAKYSVQFTMPDHDVTITAKLHYEPTLPLEPGEGLWNEATGALSITMVTPGTIAAVIKDALTDMEGNVDNNYSKVKSLTVTGKANNADMETIGSSRTMRDNMTLFDISRTNGVSEVPAYMFSDKTVLNTVLLPASVEKLGTQAFKGCTALESFTCFANTPPELPEVTAYDEFGNIIGKTQGVFDPTNFTVYVPAEALPIYAETKYWKDFELMPITQGVHSLIVNMPAGVDMQQYKDMWVELVNVKTGQTRRYVLSNRTQYTFTNLIQGTQYNLYIRNARQDILGSILAVDVEDKDVQVTFPALKPLRDITLQLRTPDGTTVGSDAFTTTWTDALGNYLATGTTLAGQMDGAQAIAKVKLGEALGTQYAQPADTLLSIGQDFVLAISLTPLPQVTLSGSVIAAATGNPIRGANIAVTQQLNGLYPRTITATSDAQGNWTLTAFEAPTEITAQADGYVPQKVAYNPSQGRTMNFSLADLTGTAVRLDLSYRPAVRAGDNTSPTTDPVAAAMFGGFDNISYTVYDETHGEELTDIVLQSQGLVLQGHDLAEGTRLRITATSPDNLFMPVTTTCAVNANGQATAALPITQLGQLKATFSQTDNSEVIGMLYDGDGQLQGSYYYGIPNEGNPAVTFTNLSDGPYTLVTMGKSSMFNSVNTLDGLTEMRLEEGRDYVRNEVAIQSGRIDSLHNQRIPMLDETVFNYTGANTRFTTNKTLVTVGNYVTLRAQVDFKADVEPADVQLFFDLPDGCSLIEGSVMAGNQLSTYEVDGNRVIVPLDNIADQVRFCIMPTKDGCFEPTASVSFNKGWNSTIQPIGSVAVNVESLSISVPEQVPDQTAYISGMAVGSAQVQVYDDDVLIGQTEAGPDGFWTAKCQLHQPYNLSQHPVYAVITTTDGITMQTGTKMVTVSHGTLTPVVTMSYSVPGGGSYQVKWDFRDNTVNPRQYTLGMGHMSANMLAASFKIDFMDGDNVVNDTLSIKDVMLYVLVEGDAYVKLPAVYNKRSNSWHTSYDFNDTALPVNVCVEYYQNDEIVMDRQQMDDMVAETELSIDETQQMVKDIYALPDKPIVLEEQPIYDELKQLLAIEDPDEATLNRIVALLNSLEAYDTDLTPSDPSGPVTHASLPDLDEWKYQWRDQTLDLLSYACSTDTIARLPKDTETQFDVPLGRGFVHFTSKKVGSIDEQALLGEGYNKMDMTDGSAIYILKTPVKEAYLDTRSHMHYVYEWREGAAANGSPLGGRLQSLALRATQRIDSIFPKAEKEHLKEIASQLFHLDENTPSHTPEGFALNYLNQGRKLLRELAVSMNNLYRSGMEIIEEQTWHIYWDVKDSCNTWIPIYNDSIIILRKKQNEAVPFQNDEDPFVKGRARETINYCVDRIPKIKEKKKELENLMKETENVFWNKIRPLLRDLPKNLGSAKRENWVYWKADSYKDTPIGLLLELYWGFYEAMDVYEDLSGWNETYKAIKAKLPCKGDPEEQRKAEQYFDETLAGIRHHGDAEDMDTYHHASEVVFAAYIEGNYNFDTYIPGESEPIDLSWYFKSWSNNHAISRGFLINYGLYPYRYYAEQKQLDKSKSQRKDLDRRIAALKCKKQEPDENDEHHGTPHSGSGSDGGSSDGSSGGSSNRFGPNDNMNTKGLIDPSGFVYEAVESNRLEGVVATCFYKETVEDMYGDLHENVAVWDAEKYAQENPLFTDAEGMYHWDVPQGLWQVKYEKEGYETAYSEWLPVPPPQLEVNIGMIQLRQPAVQQVKACTDGIDITFDKYMDPATLTIENIFVSKGGQTVGGRIELLNADSGYEKPEQQYASKVRFVPATPLTLTDKVQLTVRRAVESYAGLQMEQDFTQQFDVEQRIEAIIADSLVNIGEGGEYTMTVKVIPAEAAKDKRLTAVSLAEDVVTVVPVEGGQERTFTLKATGLGSAGVKFSLADEDLQATTLVVVRNSSAMTVAAPKASRMSGTEIYRGAEIRLTSNTAGATILYTLDGSCPCDAENTSVMVYTGPIVATGDNLVIRAIAIAKGMMESDVVEFNYKVITNIVGVEPVITKTPTDDVPVAYYTIDGRRIDRPTRGLNIVRYADGTARVMVVK